MSESLQPLVLYSKGSSPNPTKVAILLEELGLPFIVRQIPPHELKNEPYVSLNPNGRVPTLEDPNTGVKIFESGAILEYLVETYDKEKRLQYAEPSQKWLERSWLYFQVSGQGPYFGQKVWFEWSHPEKVSSAIDRYRNEIKRVTHVINDHLRKQGTKFLVGDMRSYADLAWIPYQITYTRFLVPDWDFEAEAPEFAAWKARLEDLESVKKVYASPAFDLKYALSERNLE